MIGTWHWLKWSMSLAWMHSGLWPIPAHHNLVTPSSLLSCITTTNTLHLFCYCFSFFSLAFFLANTSNSCVPLHNPLIRGSGFIKLKLKLNLKGSANNCAGEQKLVGYVKVCQMLSWWTKNVPHSINT